MIQVDQRFSEEKIRQFASQYDLLSPALRFPLEESLLWDQPIDYYYGQVSALAFAHQVIAKLPEQQMVIGATLAILCRFIVNHIDKTKECDDRDLG